VSIKINKNYPIKTIQLVGYQQFVEEGLLEQTEMSTSLELKYTEVIDGESGEMHMTK